MKTSILAALGSAVLTAAHGIVQDLTIDNTDYTGYLVFQDPYMSPVPERIVWAFPTAGNGPVTDLTTSAITCNLAATNAQLVAPAAAGSDVTFFWTAWPESHKGPVMTYLANCGGDCTTVDATTLSYFKIDEAGLNADGTWASDDLIANNNSWTVTLPSDIVAGQYLIRHELLALHSAGTEGGAQFYPMCANLQVTGSGTAAPEGVKFPGAYSATDPGILVNIYGTLTSYTIPGPTVYEGSGSNSGTTTKATTAAATTSTAVAEVTTSAAAIETTSIAAVETTSATAVETTSTAAVEVPTTSAVPITTTIIAVSTTSAAAAVTPVPTTLVTRTRTQTSAAAVPTTSAAAGSGSCSTTPEAYNKCLDAVNECIRNAQSKSGGAVNFSTCDAERSTCKMC